MSSEQRAVNGISETLPPELKRLLQGARWQADPIGESSAQTYLVQGAENFYLKINAVEPWGGLQTEAHALMWLRQYLPAPEVVYHERMDGMDYLLIRALRGLPASAEDWQSDPRRLATVLGESLRLLHALDPITCPFDQRTDLKLREVAEFVRLGLVDVDDFDDENRGLTPERILERLYAEQPPEDDLVVTHGDFCLPNIILHDWKLSGFIDVGLLGVGDRYQDLAICTGCFADQFETDRYNRHFFDAYGLPAVNEDKIRYFRLLSELR